MPSTTLINAQGNTVHITPLVSFYLAVREDRIEVSVGQGIHKLFFNFGDAHKDDKLVFPFGEDQSIKAALVELLPFLIKLLASVAGLEIQAKEHDLNGTRVQELILITPHKPAETLLNDCKGWSVALSPDVWFCIATKKDYVELYANRGDKGLYFNHRLGNQFRFPFGHALPGQTLCIANILRMSLEQHLGHLIELTASIAGLKTTMTPRTCEQCAVMDLHLTKPTP